MMRPSARAANELRSVKITRHYTKYAEGSVLIEFGDTKVCCNATVTSGVPGFMRGQDRGWLTAEYSMLPRATKERTAREAARGKQGGRTMEIQRLIGRALRQAVNLSAIGENTITVDCDVIQADGGTRTAAITGACVAMVDAIKHLSTKKGLKDKNPLRHLVAAVSVGIVNGEAVLDLDYAEDFSAETDMNIIMNEAGGFIELQGTAEDGAFSHAQLNDMLSLASGGIEQLFSMQKQVLAETLK